MTHIKKMLKYCNIWWFVSVRNPSLVQHTHLRYLYTLAQCVHFTRNICKYVFSETFWRRPSHGKAKQKCKHNGQTEAKMRLQQNPKQVHRKHALFLTSWFHFQMQITFKCIKTCQRLHSLPTCLHKGV